MSYQAIEDKLKKVMGLTATSVGSSTIARAVDVRMKNIGYGSAEVYFQTICTNADELKNLIETVIIPETWFFRDHYPFLALARLAHENGLPPKETIRVLSIPCSSGEEPYSIAMTLLQAGVRGTEFLVDAIDISSQNIIKAIEANYGSNSFREEDQSYRDRYFVIQNERYTLNQEVKDRVHFHQDNLLDFNFTPPHAAYDVIFCRNLLIYFDRPTQEKCLSIFERLLKPDGVLFVGHAETGSSINAIFEIASYPRAFAFRKRATAKKSETIKATPKKSVPVKPKKIVSATPAPKIRFERPMVPPLEPVKEVAQKSPATEAVEPLERNEELIQIETLANEGKIEEADQVCTNYLNHFPNSAQGHYLRGCILQAQSKQRLAKESLKRAIYLKPNHHGALIHLASLAENQGDKQEASFYRDRANRIRDRSGENES